MLSLSQSDPFTLSLTKGERSLFRGPWRRATTILKRQPQAPTPFAPRMYCGRFHLRSVSRERSSSSRKRFSV